MNYIQQLQADRKAVQEQNAFIIAAITNLQGYLTSPKFACGDRLDGYVNVQDVLNYLEAIKSPAVIIEDILR